MSEVFYTSDLHVGHRMVAGLRGFKMFADENGVPSPIDVQAHNDQLAANWDAVVKPEDTVYVLGDISINGGQHALDWIEERPGTKHLVAGNHDPVHPLHSRSQKLLPHWGKYFETIQPYSRRKLMGHTVLLSHFPYWSYLDGPGRDTARFEQFRLPEMGEYLLHGHTHQSDDIEHGLSFHVGVDSHNLQLVPQSEILDWIARTPKP